VTPALSVHSIISLLANAGIIVGIGDVRQGKGKGSFGTFAVAGDELGEWADAWRAITAEGARRLAAGERPSGRDLLLTPGNLTRVADRLAHLRGAAMKLGQMISLDSGDFLPPELSEILARLRSFTSKPPANSAGSRRWKTTSSASALASSHRWPTC